MTWSLLAPMYLLGGLALAIPLWVHFRNRQVVRTYIFSTLRFLIGARTTTHRFRELMRWLVLAMRLLALAGLVLAFAQPWKHTTPTATGEFSVLILDVSCSMKADAAWKEAKDSALAWLAQEGAHARTAIVLMGKSPRVLCSFDLPTSEQQTALKAVTPTFEGTEPEAALRAVDRLLDTQPALKKKITVISDMAASAWRRAEWEHPLSPGVTIEPRAALANPPANTSVAEISAPPGFWQTNVPFTVTATVRNFSAEPREVQASCQVENKQVGTEKVSLAGKEAREVSFPVLPAGFKPVRGSVKIEPSDALPDDDERFFVVGSRAAGRVGRVGSNEKADGFLKTALSPRKNAAESRYQWIPVDPGASEPLNEKVDVVLLDQGTTLSASAAERLKTFVADGGSVVVFLGEADELAGWERDWLPIELGKKHEADALSASQHFAQVKLAHPILRPFSLPRGGDLFRVKVRQWREFKSSGSQVLIELANGDPILAVIPQGKGQIVVCAFPMTREWSDWPVQSTFLPFIHQTLLWLEQKKPARRELLAGDAASDGTIAAKPGFTGTEQATGGILAVNVDPAESDLARWTALANFQQLENPEKTPSQTPLAQPSAFSSQPSALSTQDSARDAAPVIWWLLLAAALFSLSELGMANRTPR